MNDIIMVTGGAGYIGSHVVKLLLEKKQKVFIFDNLSAGHNQVLEFFKKTYGADADSFIFINADTLDEEGLRKAIDSVRKNHWISGIIDFAAKIAVGESQQKPLDYFTTNVVGFRNLLMATDHIPLVKSSTAAAYGSPLEEDIPLKESVIPKMIAAKRYDRSQLLPASVPFETLIEWYTKEVVEKYPFFYLDKADLEFLHIPVNVYGVTKVICEIMLKKHEKEAGRKHMALRYFNAAGADPSGLIGEDHIPETHLVPLVLKAAMGKVKCITVFGDDYDTPDGTCIRDYISVMDLADVHIIALNYIIKGGGSRTYNLGTNNGQTVMQIIEAAKKVTGRNIPVEMSGRREGDPNALVADASLIKKELGWKAKRGIDEIVSSAWKWHSSHPDGYK